MLKNMVERHPVEFVEHRIEFTDDEGSGFTFPCDENGEISFACPEAIANYEYALSHPEKFPVQFNQFVTYKRNYTENARGTCKCGEEVELWNQYKGACSCPKCGQWYNLFGQELIPPEYWEDDKEDY